MKPAEWCHNERCGKPRRYSDPSDAKCCGCGTPWPKRKRGKPIRAIPAHVWFLFGPDGKQFGHVFFTRPSPRAIAHAYAGHFLGRSWSTSPIDAERAKFAGVRARKMYVRASR